MKQTDHEINAVITSAIERAAAMGAIEAIEAQLKWATTQLEDLKKKVAKPLPLLNCPYCGGPVTGHECDRCGVNNLTLDDWALESELRKS